MATKKKSSANANPKKASFVLPENVALEAKGQNKFNSYVKDVEPLSSDGRGVIYVGHLPHGFFKQEITNYFSQFGKVTGVNLPLSKKTNKSMGYAFVEFHSSEVAEIVAESMNNYLMFDKLLKCEFIPHNKIHPSTFKEKYVPPRPRLISKRKHNRSQSQAQQEKSQQKANLKKTKTLEKLSKLGVNESLLQQLKSQNLMSSKKHKMVDEKDEPVKKRAKLDTNEKNTLITSKNMEKLAVKSEPAEFSGRVKSRTKSKSPKKVHTSPLIKAEHVKTETTKVKTTKRGKPSKKTGSALKTAQKVKHAKRKNRKK